MRAISPAMALLLWSVPAGMAADTVKTLKAWTFNKEQSWTGWVPGADVLDIRFETDAVSFRATGPDPIITGPQFEPIAASNTQWVELDLDTDAPGQGELFYTNKTTGQYNGFESSWMSQIEIPATGRQTISVWPFWGSLKQIIRLRFDPPSGVRTRLHGIRIVETAGPQPEPRWNFREDRGAWISFHAAGIAQQEGLMLTANAPDAVIYTPVKPFAAAERCLLRLDAESQTLSSLTLAWATSEQAGLVGEPIVLKGPLKSELPLDLRIFPNWKGTVTGLAIGFGMRKADRLKLRSLSVEACDPAKPLLRLRHAYFEKPLVRAGERADLRLVFEHAGGPPSPEMELGVSAGDGRPIEKFMLPPLAPDGSATIRPRVLASPEGAFRVTVHVNGQKFQRLLDVAPQLPRPTSPSLSRYNVPTPRPVKTHYEIGVYYFPGWAGEQGAQRWQKQAEFPERDPLLGWYREGDPEVADWHIKWAVENGITFFLYDWYWRDGKETLGEGLNDGFLNARYSGLMKFAVMWANHRPFSDHTPQQLLQVTDYWIEHYLRRPNYWTYQGKPYVNFYEPNELIRCLGSEEKVKIALESMRQRARAAGLPGLHIATCIPAHRGTIERVGRCGFDSVTAYTYARAGAFLSQSPYEAFIEAYPGIWDSASQMSVPPYMPLQAMNWDARPWHGPRTECRYGRTTELFARGLKNLKSWLDQHGQRTALFEAWNEWGEGAFLEPNRQFGFGDLEAIRDVFAEPGDWPQNVWPGDLGLADRYDIRASTQPARAP